ncbi:helix-turn-helix domain-containing protein [Anaerovoracaceae bacterium 41-7]
MIIKKSNKKRGKFGDWRKNNRNSVIYILSRHDMDMIVKHKLSATDMLILTMINTSDGFGDCYFKDSYFADLLNKDESTIRYSISKLKKLGLIHSCKVNNRRYLMATKFDKFRVDDILTDEELNQKLDMAKNIDGSESDDEVYKDLYPITEQDQKGVESNDNLSYS